MGHPPGVLFNHIEKTEPFVTSALNDMQRTI